MTPPRQPDPYAAQMWLTTRVFEVLRDDIPRTTTQVFDALTQQFGDLPDADDRARHWHMVVAGLMRLVSDGDVVPVDYAAALEGGATPPDTGTTNRWWKLNRTLTPGDPVGYLLTAAQLDQLAAGEPLLIDCGPDQVMELRCAGVIEQRYIRSAPPPDVARRVQED